MKIEKFISWCCVLVLGTFALLLAFNVVTAIFEGQIEAFSKYGHGRSYLRSEDPVGFWIAILPHFLIVALFCWFTHWTWFNRVRNK